jgi:hypothetical protein
VPGQPVAGGRGHDAVDPALDEREQRLQPAQRRLLLGGLLGLEQPAAQQRLDALGVGRVDPAHRTHRLVDAALDGLAVDVDAARVGVDRVVQLLAQPRHVTNSRWVAASRSARNSRTSSAGRSRPAANSATFCGSRTPAPAGASGMPISPLVRTSPESRPRAWPTWAPNISPPIRPMIPASGPAIAAASAGSALVMAPTTRSASGSIRLLHAGSVCSTHSTRDQASGRSTPEGSSVTGSSHRSARRRASATAVRSASEVGCDPAASELIAPCRARSQLTGPPDQVISFCSSANSGILASRSSGVPPPAAPPPKRAPSPNGSLARRTGWSRRSGSRSGRPKPNGTSLMPPR